ncbi:Putative UDP-glucuronosyltransferase ugt-55 [Toxocara canis]|uniref:glucuronosyltransferase n=1 Tax=Toxocara canis TaxID=6265 RepID=A0A0B2W3J0_TOXCA|nr:Putative UDP-glucuronosyltransferase ugt-55 [Toxocara canis]
MSSALILSVVVLLSSCCEGHKILVYSPKLFWSHVGFMGRIADILVGAGHDVVVLMPECDERIKTNGTLLARTIHASCNFDGLSEMLSFLDDVWAVNAERMDFLFHVGPQSFVFVSNSRIRSLLGDVELMRRLRDEKFDLGISEAFSFCGFGIFEKIGLHKYLIASNAELMEALTEPFGISYNPSHVPESEYVSLWTAALEYAAIRKRKVEGGITSAAVSLWLRSFSIAHFTRSPQQETMARCPSVFVNTNILLDFPREVNSKVVFVGGITASQSSSLSELLVSAIHMSAAAKDAIISVEQIGRRTNVSIKMKKVEKLDSSGK